MSGHLALFLLLAPMARVQGFEELEKHLAEGRFRDAQLALSSEGDPLRRAWGEVELSFRSRDFARALGDARGFLVEYPSDARLHLRAAGAALWLEDTGAARLEIDGLESSLASMSADALQGWAATVADLKGQLERLGTREASVRRTTARARSVALGAIAAALLGFGLLLRRLG